MKIINLLAYQILDSRGQPTVAVKLFLENDQSVIAMVPSGASTGAKEALELRAVSYTHLTLPTICSV